MTEMTAQKVTVSNEINIRSNILYDIIGRVDDKILFYKDKGTQREILLYNNDLVFQSERQINLDQRRCKIYDVVNIDSAFAVIYSYGKKGKQIVKLDIFSNTGSRMDSVELFKLERDWRHTNFKTVVSEDRSKIALYDMFSSNQFKLLIVDIENQKALRQKEYIFEDINLYSDAEQVLIANNGSLFLLAQKNNFRNKKRNHTAHIYQFNMGSEDVIDISVDLKDIVCQDLIITLNDSNTKIGLAGLYHEKKSDESTGYFWIKGNVSRFGTQELKMIPFEEEIYLEIYGERNKGRLENFLISDVVWKAGDTPILILEMSYDVNRRTGTFSTMQLSDDPRSPNNYRRGWSDHYRDDLILISLNNEGKKDWHQVFYKKQFSQSDNAVFSSFFPFITPSRMRLIYNDEIKSNSTVSEYVLDAHGNYKRKSVLSTEYQDLKLRFSNADQISSTELLVPSQSNYGVNIVKIDFGSQ